MNRLVVVRLSGQTSNGGYQTITEIGNERAASDIEIRGCLPALNQELLKEFEEWRDAFLRLDLNTRLKVKKISVEENDYRYYPNSLKEDQKNNYLVAHVEKLAKSLSFKFHKWLDSEGFRETLQKLKTKNSLSDNIQIIVCTNDTRIFSLPWNSWDFLELFKNASVSFSSSSESYSSSSSRQPERWEGLKVLAIMGDNDGIDLERDLAIIKNSNSPDIFVRNLRQPSSEILRRELERGCWDILFFSGHSETINGKGILYLGHGESIFLSDLRSSLRKSISKGLKLAIFNSCDGIGLAKDIQDFQIPQVIVMREPIPDKVAHAFLSFYIEGIQEIENGSPFYLAEKYARAKVSSELVCADWLPIIFQNHKVPSPVKGVLRKSRTADTSRPDPNAEIRRNIQITFEDKPRNCRVTQPVSKDSIGEIQYLGAHWKAQIVPINTYVFNDTIFFPGDEVCVVARKGNLYFVASPQALGDDHRLDKVKKIIDKEYQHGESNRKLEISGFKMHMFVCFWLGLIGIFAISLVSISGAKETISNGSYDALRSESVNSSN